MLGGFWKKSNSAFFALIGIFATFSAPALAEEAFPIDTIRKTQGSTGLGDSDPAFRELFKSWAGAGRTAADNRLTIPSRQPVDAARLTSSYGLRSDPFTGGRRAHKGLDMAGPVGTPIYATADGIVGRAQWVSGYGKYVELNHGNEVQTRYGHLSQLLVQPNQRVKAGDLIGLMGSTGRSTGSHLHYEVRIAGEAVNPIPFMQSNDFLLAQGRNGAALGGPAN